MRTALFSIMRLVVVRNYHNNPEERKSQLLSRGKPEITQPLKCW